MGLLDQLPQDLWLLLFKEWLNVRLIDISNLDVAICSHSLRMEWLPLVPRLRVEEDTTRRPIGNFLAWMQNRKAHLDKILVDMRMLESFCPNAFVLPATQFMKFIPAGIVTSCTGISCFLSCFPNLTSLDCEYCPLSHHHQLELRDLRCPLRELNIGACTSISPALMALIVAGVSGTLDELYCGVLDSVAVDKLARCCRGIRKIGWKCDNEVSSESILAFCRSNPELDYISFEGRHQAGSPISSALMTAIAQACPKLKDVFLDSHCKIDYDLIAVFISTCPAIDYISIMDGVVVVHSDKGKRYCNVYRNGDCPAASTLSMLISIPLPIQVFGQDERIMRVDSRCIALLADRHGASLINANFAFSPDVQRSDMQHFLANCPHLVVLILLHKSVPGEVVIEDEDLLALPTRCPKLKQLRLDGCADTLTDAAVIAALRRYQGNGMTYIGLNGCTLLTNAVLQVIDELFPNIQVLMLLDATISQDTLLAFVLKRMHCLRYVAPPDLAMKLWLEKQLKDRHWKGGKLKIRVR